MRLTRGCALRAANACLCQSRFVPPWERSGKTADDFFGSLMQSKNPVQTLRRDEAASDQLHDQLLRDDPISVEERVREESAVRRHVEETERRKNFLPYGSTPKGYFDTSKMAAWGEYTSSLSAAGGAYSKEATALLQNDLHESLPYAVEECPKSTSGKEWPFHGTAGVVLDIDGVIYRSKKVIPGSDSAVKMMRKLKIPFVFMTNGGGLTEAEKAEELSTLLQCHINADEVVLAHSPMQLLAEHYRDANVLIGGSRRSEEVARSYGFKNPISIQRFQDSYPELVPYRKKNGKCEREVKPITYPSFEAVMVFSDLLDVMADVQVLLDILYSPNGQIGHTVSSFQSIPFYMAADDLLWSTEAPLPRIGGGAIREMLGAVIKCVTGNGLNAVMYGKPRRIAYAFAERQLKRVSLQMGWDPSDMRNIFMVGDNLETDIIGANAAGGLWTSVHVLSGIGAAPAAFRTIMEGDLEASWMSHVPTSPHYVAPTLDHFVRELISLPENIMTGLKQPYYGAPNPTDLRSLYNFRD